MSISPKYQRSDKTLSATPNTNSELEHPIMSNPSANPALYGHARPKNKPIPISQSSIHSLSTELTLAKQRLGNSSSNTTTRHRGEKSKSLFSSSNKGVSARAARDLVADNDHPRTNKSADGSGLTDAELAMSRRKMEEKSKMYDKLRKGEYIPPTKKRRGGGGGGDGVEEEGLIDFDRKWRDEGSGSDNDSEADDDEEGNEIGPAAPGEEVVEYTDEFGRTRTAPKSVAEKHMRELQAAGGEDSLRNNPDQPNPNLIYGSVIQTHAFTTATYSSLPEHLPNVEDLPSLKPGAEERHYDANSEIRTKGVGFYGFSTDNEQRKKEIEALEAATRKTHAERKKKEEARMKRKEEIEKRREEIRKRKREVVGSKWLDGLMGELESRGKEEDDKKLGMEDGVERENAET